MQNGAKSGKGLDGTAQNNPTAATPTLELGIVSSFGEIDHSASLSGSNRPNSFFTTA